MEIQNEIDKLLTLKESFSKIANSYSSLVPKEFVTIQLHAENTDLSAYKIKVVNTTSGNEEFYDISASGYTEFKIKYDSVYEIVFPIIGTYITPATRTFTAQKPIRKIEASYVIVGVFGMDANGRKYSIAAIEALSDKSIIKYGGYTDEYLQNCIRKNGEVGCGFMWDLNNNESIQNEAWSNTAVEFSQDLLPFCAGPIDDYYDGETDTDYMIYEGQRLNVGVPAATVCKSKIIQINGTDVKGFLPAPAQIYRLIALNINLFKNLYNACGLVAPETNSVYLWTSTQSSSNKAIALRGPNTIYSAGKIYADNLLVVFPLPK